MGTGQRILNVQRWRLKGVHVTLASEHVQQVSGNHGLPFVAALNSLGTSLGLTEVLSQRVRSDNEARKDTGMDRLPPSGLPFVFLFIRAIREICGPPVRFPDLSRLVV